MTITANIFLSLKTISVLNLFVQIRGDRISWEGYGMGKKRELEKWVIPVCFLTAAVSLLQCNNSQKCFLKKACCVRI